MFEIDIYIPVVSNRNDKLDLTVFELRANFVSNWGHCSTFHNCLDPGAMRTPQLHPLCSHDDARLCAGTRHGTHGNFTAPD